MSASAAVPPSADEGLLLRVRAAVEFRRAAEDELDEAILTAWDHGVTDRQIGDVVGVSASAIHQRRQRIWSGRAAAPQHVRWL